MVNVHTDFEPKYYTVLAFAWQRRGERLAPCAVSRLGRAAAEICDGLGAPMGRVPDTRHGMLPVFPEAVLDEVFRAEWED